MMSPRLSKSRYLSGLQCSKRLYLEISNRDLATPFDDATQAILDTRTEVGELARDRYPGGVLGDVECFKVEETSPERRRFWPIVPSPCSTKVSWPSTMSWSGPTS
jgi:hypothetical protein